MGYLFFLWTSSKNYFYTNFSHLLPQFIKVNHSLLDPNDILQLNMELKVAHTHCMCVYQLKCGFESVLNRLHNLHLASDSEIPLGSLRAFLGRNLYWVIFMGAWQHTMAHHHIYTPDCWDWIMWMFDDTVNQNVGCLQPLNVLTLFFCTSSSFGFFYHVALMEYDTYISKC